METAFAQYATWTNFAILGSLAFIVHMYIKIREKFKYWEKRGVDGPKDGITPFIRLFCGSKNMYEGTLENNRKYGQVFGSYLLTKPVFSVGDPELIKDITVKDFHIFVNHPDNLLGGSVLDQLVFFIKDDKWRKTRHTLTPTFTSGKLKRTFNVLSDCVDDFITELLKEPNDINLEKPCSSYSLDVIARCCFATNCNIYSDPNSEFVKNANQVLKPSPLLFLNMVLPKFMEPLLEGLGMDLNISTSFRYFKDVITLILKERKEKNIQGNDFLQILLETDQNVKNKVDEHEVVLQLLNFFLAGKDTMVQLLKFAFYHLAVNPEAQQILLEEAKKALDQDGNLSYESVTQLEYLDAFVSEVLRMYPFVGSTREALEDYKLGNTGITIPKGTFVIYAIYSLHMNPEYFPEPTEFKPERFLPENKQNIRPYTYIPFGIGPRNCLGMRFALLQAKVVLIKTLLALRFRKTPKTDEPPQFLPGFGVFVPCKPLIVSVDKRD